MGKLEKSIVENLKKHFEIPKTPAMHPYCLTHTYDETVRRLYVAAPYDLDEFEAICAYIQFECSELEESFSMDQEDVIEILERFYGCKKVKRTAANQVDLYVNWEAFCDSKVQEVECLKRDGMDVYFKKYIEAFYQSNPEWRSVEV